MALSRADAQPLGLQWQLKHIPAIVFAIAGTAVGWFFAHSLTRLPSGYLTSYVILQVLVVEALLTLIGALLLAWRKTRAWGIGLIIAGLFTFATYVVGGRILWATNRIPWHPPAIHLVSRQSIVVRLRSGTTEQQAQSLISTKLQFLPWWSDSLEREPTGIVLTISDKAYRRGETSPQRRKMLADDVSSFMVIMRRDPRISSVELQHQP